MLPNCGTIGAHQPNKPITAADRAVISCLIEAKSSGAKAEMSFTRLSTEGDPIRYWIRVLGSNTVEQFEHSSDSFGEKGWFVSECAGVSTDPTDYPLPTGCGERKKL